MRWLLFTILYFYFIFSISCKSASDDSQYIISVSPTSVEIDDLNPKDIKFTIEFIPSIIINSGETQITIINSDLSVSLYKSNYTLYSEGENIFSFTIPKNDIVLGSFRFQTLVNDTIIYTEEIILSPKEDTLMFNLANEGTVECKAPFVPNSNKTLCVLCENVDSNIAFYDYDVVGEDKCVPSCNKYIYKEHQCTSECTKIQSKSNLVIQGNKCVEQCTGEFGIHPKQSELFCFDCSISEDYPIASHGKCVCNYGLIMNKENRCVLPLDDNGKKEEENCLDFCYNGGYCYIENKIPRCNCEKTSFLGIACDIKESEATQTAKQYIDDIINYKMSITNVTLMTSALSLSTMLRDKPDLVISEITSSVDSIASRAKFFEYNPSSDGKKALEMVGLAMLSVMKSSQKTRRLLEMNYIEDLARRASEIGSSIASNILGSDSSYTSYKVHSEVIDVQFFYPSKKEAITQYKKESKKKGYVTFDFENTNSTLSGIMVQVNIIDVSKTYNNITLLSSSSSSNEGYITLQNINLFYYTNNINDTYYLYKNAGIDIYNPNDKAFTEYCYFNTYFRYDLHQTYRKKGIYQNKTFALKDLEEQCEYYGIENNQTIFNCSDITISPNGDASLITLIEIEKNITTLNGHKDLSLICVQHINKIEQNFAFWFFLIITVFTLILNIVIFAISCCQEISNDFYLAAENDGFVIGDSKEVSGVIQPSNNLINNFPQMDLCSLLQHNFEELHPLPSLAYNSIITPQTITTWFFMFNIFNLFGFNAVYLSEDMFNDRLLDKHRDNFGYPMKREFDKIISAIATSVLLAITMRAIIIVPLFMRNYLADDIARAKNQRGKFQEVQHFNMKMLPRRIVALVLMVLLCVFFFYYSIVFCGIYVNTQFGWFYSGIWSLFWVWGVFAPIYIIIISIIEYNGNPNCTYYLKRFFIF